MSLEFNGAVGAADYSARVNSQAATIGAGVPVDDDANFGFSTAVVGQMETNAGSGTSFLKGFILIDAVTQGGPRISRSFWQGERTRTSRTLINGSHHVYHNNGTINFTTVDLVCDLASGFAIDSYAQISRLRNA